LQQLTASELLNARFHVSSCIEKVSSFSMQGLHACNMLGSHVLGNTCIAFQVNRQHKSAAGFPECCTAEGCSKPSLLASLKSFELKQAAIARSICECKYRKQRIMMLLFSAKQAATEQFMCKCKNRKQWIMMLLINTSGDGRCKEASSS
jgi:hypothetical protein